MGPRDQHDDCDDHHNRHHNEDPNDGSHTHPLVQPAADARSRRRRQQEGYPRREAKSPAVTAVPAARKMLSSVGGELPARCYRGMHITRNRCVGPARINAGSSDAVAPRSPIRGFAPSQAHGFCMTMLVWTGGQRPARGRTRPQRPVQMRQRLWLRRTKARTGRPSRQGRWQRAGPSRPCSSHRTSRAAS
jgi:hypothetical protein